MAWRRVCGQQWVMNCPGWGYGGVSRLRRACGALELSPLTVPAAFSFPSGPGIHLKHKVRRAPASFWFTKGSAGAWAATFLAHPSHPAAPACLKMGGRLRLLRMKTLEALGFDLNTGGNLCVEKVQRVLKPN